MSTESPKNKLCLLRDIFRSIREFEIGFQENHDLCLNEGMALCTLKQGKMSSSDLADRLGLSTSNMSKVIKSIEDKGFVERILGKEDKRQMYFVLSSQGSQKLKQLCAEEPHIDTVLESIYATKDLEIVGFR